MEDKSDDDPPEDDPEELEVVIEEGGVSTDGGEVVVQLAATAGFVAVTAGQSPSLYKSPYSFEMRLHKPTGPQVG